MEKDNLQQTIEKFLLRVNKEVKEAAETVAKANDRSLNGYIVNLLKEDLRKRGAL